MKEFLSLTMGNGEMHHAYILEGESNVILPTLNELLFSYNLPSVGHNDYFFQEYQNFGIEDARNLKTHANSPAFSGGKRIFVLDIGSFNREAEHALLKLFEEPIVGTHFFLRMNDSSHVLPTLLSRVIVVTNKKSENKNDSKEAKAFLKLPYKDRLTFVTKLVAKHDKDESTFELKQEARTFVHQLMTVIHTDPNITKDAKYGFYIQELQNVDTYLLQQGSSSKILLEHLSLILPLLE